MRRSCTPRSHSMVLVAALLLAVLSAQGQQLTNTTTPTATLELNETETAASVAPSPQPTPQPTTTVEQWPIEGAKLNGALVCNSQLTAPPGAWYRIDLNDPLLNETLLSQVSASLTQNHCFDGGYAFIELTNIDWVAAPTVGVNDTNTSNTTVAPPPRVSTSPTLVVRNSFDGAISMWHINNDSQPIVKEYAWHTQPSGNAPTVVQVRGNISAMGVITLDAVVECVNRTCPEGFAGIAMTPEPPAPTPTPSTDGSSPTPTNTTVSSPLTEGNVESTAAIPTWLIAAVVVVAVLIIVCCVMAAARNSRDKQTNPQNLSKYRVAEERRFDQSMPTVSTGDDESPARNRIGDGLPPPPGGYIHDHTTVVDFQQ